MKVKFWGTRGSIAVPGKDTTVYGGNTSCLEMNLESGRKIIVDAGTGIRALGDHLVVTGEPVDVHLLVTHVHWDHVQGFPFFDPIFSPETKIIVDGYPTCMRGLRAIFDNKMGDGFFPVKFDDLSARIQYLERLRHGPLELEGVVIDTIPLHHPQGGFGFRFQEGDKKLVFITDNELGGDPWAGRGLEDYARFCRDADILIHDSQFTRNEIDQHKGWGHSDYEAALDLALKAHVKRLILFHHNPSRKDAELAKIETHIRELAERNGADLITEAAREASELSL